MPRVTPDTGDSMDVAPEHALAAAMQRVMAGRAGERCEVRQLVVLIRGDDDSLERVESGFDGDGAELLEMLDEVGDSIIGSGIDDGDGDHAAGDEWKRNE